MLSSKVLRCRSLVAAPIKGTAVRYRCPVCRAARGALGPRPRGSAPRCAQGFQRLFTSSRQIVLLDKHTKTARLCGVHDAFTRKHFCSYIGLDGAWSDELEDEWARLENAALPAARRLVEGSRDPAARNEMKILAAIHYVRTDTFVEMHERIAMDVVNDY